MSQFRSTVWKVCGLVTRTLFIISRAIPEYIYAYLLIGLLGISAWPLVLALALHNFGILGRLWGEVIENQPPAAAQQLMHTGSSRLQCYFASYQAPPTQKNPKNIRMMSFERSERSKRAIYILYMAFRERYSSTRV